MAKRFSELTHDIRGKVTAILLAASLINEGKAGPCSDQQLEISGLIIREAEDLHAMLMEMVSLVTPA
jgi:hypothetical protein